MTDETPSDILRAIADTHPILSVRTEAQRLLDARNGLDRLYDGGRTPAQLGATDENSVIDGFVMSSKPCVQPYMELIDLKPMQHPTDANGSPVEP